MYLRRGREIGIGYLGVGGERLHHRAPVALAAIIAQQIPGRHVADAEDPSFDQAIDVG